MLLLENEIKILKQKKNNDKLVSNPPRQFMTRIFTFNNFTIITKPNLNGQPAGFGKLAERPLPTIGVKKKSNSTL